MLNIARPRGVLGACVVLNAAVLTVAAHAGEVVRTPLPGTDTLPISAAVTVPAGYDTVFVSGTLPSVIDKDAKKGSVETYGDMTTQTVSALSSISATLARLGLGMGDVVKMTVFMVADASGKLDFSGMMTGYSKFFGTPDQPNKPARSAVQVAALATPGALLEIEVIAAKPPQKARP